MKRILYSYMKNTSISKREAQVLSEISNRDMIVFTPNDIRRFLNTSSENTNRILQSMVKKDLIKRLEVGKYISKENYNKLDIYDIATSLFIPSYLSHFSALHFHHMTDQVPRTVYITTTKRKRKMELQGNSVKFITVDPLIFFGYERYGRVVVSDPEKTIIDSLRIPEYSGGINHIISVITNDLNTDRLIDYAIKINSSSLSSRLGFILEKKGFDFDKELLKRSITTYSKLEPGKDSKTVNTFWKIYTEGDLDC